MARSPSLLFLLSLGLGCCAIQDQKYRMTAKFRDSKITHPQLRQRLELECLPIDKDSGISWIRQDKHGTLHFVVFISTLSRTTFKGNTETSTRFEATRDSRTSRLVVKSFLQQDEGNYFCLINNNQILYFSTGQPVFLPVTTTRAPTTAAPTTLSSIPKAETRQKTPAPETSKEEVLNFSCDIFIWIPLGCGCLLLLIALLITITLCQKTRRRRCRCKRPANRKPQGKPGMPNRHI
ncbi:T-cell surface glycoprotein CD8 alpha chain [Dromaius novaehollandiae]|uniref:T-cell surface glycoprotein CD8 alpha chain n=1 Tax=Dromaius novaehollandiae TaxID=8790 RepID=UPI00311D6BB7